MSPFTVILSKTPCDSNFHNQVKRIQEEIIFHSKFVWPSAKVIGKLHPHFCHPYIHQRIFHHLHNIFPIPNSSFMRQSLNNVKEEKTFDQIGENG